MSDLTFNVVALDRASKTFLSAAESVDRLEARLNKLDGTTATANVNVKTDESTKALDSFTNRFTLMTAGIAAASPLAGAAILGGIGAAFIGVAATAQASNQQVQQTYKTLWSNVVQDTKAATNVLVPQLVASGNQIGHTFEALEPQMRRAFSAAGPDLQALTNGVTQFATNAMPGVTAAMSSSLPVFQGVEHAASDLGTAVGTSFASMGQNSAAYGATVQSFGQILSTVITLGISLVNDLAQVWAASGQEISTAVSAVGQVVTGLASGALPVLSEGLSAAARVMTVVANVLEPIAPILGTVGTAALVTWGAFKLAAVVTGGVNALASGVLNMGVAMETGAARATAAGFALEGVGARAATASVGTAAVASSLAGPVGIAVAGAAVGFGLLSGLMGNSSNSAQHLAGSLEGVAGALQASNGQINAAVIGAVQADGDFKDAAESARQFGIAQAEITGAITTGGGAYDALVAKLQKIIDTHHKWTTVAGGSQVDSGLNDTGQAAQDLLDKLRDLDGKWKGVQVTAEQNTAALQQHANQLTSSKEGMAQANSIAEAYGINVAQAAWAMNNLAATSGNATIGLQGVAREMSRDQLATSNAAAAIGKTFEEADNRVTQARNSVASAAHGAEQASRAVADAMHGEQQAARAVQQAHQGVADAQRGVETAQRSYVDAQRQERDAQVSLNEARQQAIRDLKAMHQQLDDQFTSEASSRVRLFDAQTAGLNLGITSSNARQIASGPVTAENEDKVKAAIDLLSAQNSLNAALQNGANLKQDVAAADARGVEGSKGVVSAQQQLTSAQRAVQDASRGVEQAQRAVVQAQQAVSDASYAQQRAHQAVKDAQYQQTQASQQLGAAQQNLTTAVADTSRTLDGNSDAARRNLGMLQTLSDAILKEYGPNAAGYNTLIQETADKFGITTGAAQDLLAKLGEIPKDWKFGMTAVAGVDTASLKAVFGGYYNDSMNQRKTIGGTGYAAGGQVFGEGGPRDDKIHAMLSDREWIHPVDAVDYYGPEFMRAVQTKRFPKFATGGQATMSDFQALGFGSGAGAAYATNITALETMGFPHPPQLPKYVPPPMNVGYPTGGAATGGDALAAQNYARSVLGFYGWGQDQMAPLISLWNGESGWLWWKRNPSSGAYGIPQALPANKMAAAGPDWLTNPATQINWGLGYIKGRHDYGSPAAAWSKWLSRSPHWYADGGQVMAGSLAHLPRPRAYDNGGALPPGLSTVYNGTGKPENVRTSSQEDQLLQAMRDMRAALDRAFTRPMEGTLRTERGALFGEFRAMWRDVERQGGVRL